MHQSLRRVPDDVADRLLGVDTKEVLEDGEERDLLRCVLDPVVDGVEYVQVRGEIDIVRPRSLGLVALPLLLEDVQLDPEVRVSTGRLDLPQYFQQLQTCSSNLLSDGGGGGGGGEGGELRSGNVGNVGLMMVGLTNGW